MIIVTVVIIALFLIGAAASALTPGPYQIAVTDRTLRSSRSGKDTTYTALLYNRRIQRTAIGSSITSCKYLGRGGILGDGAHWCSSSFSLPEGTITAHGVVRNPFFYNLSVTGGTDLYLDVVGSLTVKRFKGKPTRNQLIFRLRVPE